MKQPTLIVIQYLAGSHSRGIVRSRHWCHDTARNYLALAERSAFLTAKRRGGSLRRYEVRSAMDLSGRVTHVGDVVVL